MGCIEGEKVCDAIAACVEGCKGRLSKAEVVYLLETALTFTIVIP
jgi:hypothetical protein